MAHVTSLSPNFVGVCQQCRDCATVKTCEVLRRHETLGTAMGVDILNLCEKCRAFLRNALGRISR